MGSGCNTTGGGGDAGGGRADAAFGFDTIHIDAAGPGEDAALPGDLPHAEDLPLAADLLPAEDLVPVGDTPLVEDAPIAQDAPPYDVPGDTGPAAAYEPCLEDEDCESQICGWHFGDKLCLDYCTECPMNFACAEYQPEPGIPDIVYVCASRFSHLCLPCWSDEDCRDELTDNHACVKLGSIGGFCATVSDVPGADPVCPEGYIVSNTLALVGEDPTGPPAGIVSGCVPPMGICTCTETAAVLGLSTFCFSGGDDEGWCIGERVCTADGMSACSVGPPSDEVCDGVDNDCDGETDEGFCDDGDVCTQDTCGGQTGCLFEPLSGIPCDDGDPCTTGDACLEGVCSPGAQVPCDDANTCTADSCEAGVGCVFSPVSDCCGNGVEDPGEECDDGNQEDGDGCDGACVQEEMDYVFVGYTTFYHDVCSQTFEETDAFMDAACAAAYGPATQAASIPELLAGIDGLAAYNNSGDWVMFKCPFCEGSPDYWTCNGQPTSCRKGVNDGDPWPTTPDAGWNMNMCSADRTAMCIQ